MPDSMGTDLTTRFNAVYPGAAPEPKAILVSFLPKAAAAVGKSKLPDGISRMRRFLTAAREREEQS